MADFLSPPPELASMERSATEYDTGIADGSDLAIFERTTMYVFSKLVISGCPVVTELS